MGLKSMSSLLFMSDARDGRTLVAVFRSIWKLMASRSPGEWRCGRCVAVAGDVDRVDEDDDDDGEPDEDVAIADGVFDRVVSSDDMLFDVLVRDDIPWDWADFKPASFVAVNAAAQQSKHKLSLILIKSQKVMFEFVQMRCLFNTCYDSIIFILIFNLNP